MTQPEVKRIIEYKGTEEKAIEIKKDIKKIKAKDKGITMIDIKNTIEKLKKEK